MDKRKENLKRYLERYYKQGDYLIKLLSVRRNKTRTHRIYDYEVCSINMNQDGYNLYVTITKHQTIQDGHNFGSYMSDQYDEISKATFMRKYKKIQRQLNDMIGRVK